MGRNDRQRGNPEIVVFGRHPVEEALASDGVEVLEVALARERPAEERRDLARLAEARGVCAQEMSREAMSRLTRAPRHDQGVAARIRLLRVVDLTALIERLKGRGARRPTHLLGLDGVTNSQNVGMVVRSIAGAGLAGLLWPLEGHPWVNGLVVRAAAGAIFECPIVLCDSLATGLAELQGAGFTCLGLDTAGQGSLFDRPPPHRAVYVLGSESRGLSPEVKSQLDALVSIPMRGRVESLNVAVAAGLVSFYAAGLLTPGSGRLDAE